MTLIKELPNWMMILKSIKKNLKNMIKMLNNLLKIKKKIRQKQN